MEKQKITREEALQRWKASKERKKTIVATLTDMLCQDYQKQTGNSPQSITVW